jgi:PAS domain S-box-containing protein
MRGSSDTIKTSVARRTGESDVAEGIHDAELLELFLMATTDGVVDWNVETNRCRYSTRWKMMLGYEESALVDSLFLWRDLTHPDDIDVVLQRLNDHIASFWPFSHTFRLRHARGDYRSVLCRVVSLRDASGRPRRLLGVFSDVTDQVRAEERQRGLACAVPDLVLRIGADGTVLDQKLPEDLHGASPSDYAEVGAPLAAWTAAAAFHGRVLSVLHEGRAGVITTFEAALALRTRTRPVEVRVSRSSASEVACIVRDLSETQRLRQERLQASKLEAVGQLAAGIAHEINTPLQFIGDNLAFLGSAFRTVGAVLDAEADALNANHATISAEIRARLRALREDADLEFMLVEAPRAVDAALDGSRQVGRIVRAMKEFSHPGQTQMVLCDLNQVVESTVTISRNVWKYVAELKTELSSELPRVLCHPGEMSQVLLNLIVNATHAIADVVGDGARGRGQIRVSTCMSGRFVELRVTDTGSGIPEAVRARIFDPFFTTKEVGRGTGQGLWLARSTVVERHGGQLTFETQLGAGSSFSVKLPLPRPSMQRASRPDDTG